MKKKKNTIYFLIALLILIGSGFIIQNLFFGNPGATAIIEQNGEKIYELDLNENTSLILEDGQGGSNTITIANGTIAVTDANCPDLVCVHTGAISHTGEIIACLPHTLIITISETDPQKTDSTAW